jgi:hypothetical protein
MTQATDNNDPSDANDNSTVDFTYDTLSRLTQTKQKLGATQKTISATFADIGTRSSLTYPDSTVANFTYRYLLGVNLAKKGANKFADYDCIGPGRVKQRQYYNIADGSTAISREAGSGLD